MNSRITLRYRVVDVFTSTPLEGNPLAVFPDAAGLDPSAMQKIARELNLSETTFVVPPTRPDCAARIRIFTPFREMVFAGHPTIGTAFVLLDEQKVQTTDNRFSLQEEVGPVPVRVDPESSSGESPKIWLTTPPIQFGRKYDPLACALALTLDVSDVLPDVEPQWASAGSPKIFIPLRDQAAVDRAVLDPAGFAKLKSPENAPVCIFLFTPTTMGAYSRMFAPDHGIAEDPATGSATGPLAAYMMQNNLIRCENKREFISEQGTKMGRRSILYIRILNENEIEVGGHVAPLVEATMTL